MKLIQNKLAHVSSTFAVTKAKELPHGQFEAILSTQDLDRHGEIVSIPGIEIPKDQVIKMYYNHETRGQALPIGKWNKITKKDGKLIGVGEIDMEDDFAVKVYKKIKGGFLDSISIGFMPLDYDGDTSTWTKSRLHEASVVAEPANTGAVVTSKELGFTEEEFKTSLKVKLKEVETENADDSDKDGVAIAELKAAFDELKSKFGAIETAVQASIDNPTMKTLITVRVAGKEVDKSAEALNTIIKVKLKETQNV